MQDCFLTLQSICYPLILPQLAPRGDHRDVYVLGDRDRQDRARSAALSFIDILDCDLPRRVDRITHLGEIDVTSSLLASAAAVSGRVAPRKAWMMSNRARRIEDDHS